MQNLKNYLTLSGWGKDLKETIEDFKKLFGKQTKPQDLSEEILSSIGGLGAEILRNAFKSLGAKPTRLSVDVLLGKGDSLELYLVPERQYPHNLYGSEERAKANLRPGETLYRLNIYRLE